MPRFRPRLVQLEDRSTPATLYVSQAFEILNDTTPTGPSAGDTVQFTTGSFPVSGLTFGVTAYGSLSSAIAGASSGDTIQFGSETLTVETGVVIDKTLSFFGHSTVGNPPTAVLRPAADAAKWLRVLSGVKLDVTGVTFDGLAGTRTIGEAIHYDAGSQGGLVQHSRLVNVSGVGVVSEAGGVNVDSSSFENVGGGVQFSGGGTQTFGSNTYAGRGSGGTGEVAVAFAPTSGAVFVVSGNNIHDASGAAITVAAVEGASVNAVGNSLTNNGTGLAVTGSASAGVTAQYNTIAGNGVGVSTTGALIDATNVWWGTVAGPVAPNNTTTGKGVTTSPPLDGGPPPIIFGTTPSDYLFRAGLRGAGNPPSQGVVLAAGFTDGRASPLVFGAGPGAAPLVTYRLPSDTEARPGFLAYDASFTGGVRVAVYREAKIRMTVATAPGPGGGPNVKLFGLNGNERASFFAYDPSFTGGVYVALADVNADDVPDIITGAGEGGAPHVKVFDGKTLNLIGNFFAFDPSFRGGVRVAALNDGLEMRIVVASGPGSEPLVRGFTAGGVQLFDVSPYESSFTGGVYAATGDVDADGVPDLITGAGEGGGARVRVYSLQRVIPTTPVFDPNSPVHYNPTPAQDFFALDPADRIGVTVAVGESGPLVEGVALPPGLREVKPGEIVVGRGAGGVPRVRVISQVTGDSLFDGLAFDASIGGVAVGALGIANNAFPASNMFVGGTV